MLYCSLICNYQQHSSERTTLSKHSSLSASSVAQLLPKTKHSVHSINYQLCRLYNIIIDGEVPQEVNNSGILWITNLICRLRTGRCTESLKESSDIRNCRAWYLAVNIEWANVWQGKCLDGRESRECDKKTTHISLSLSLFFSARILS